MVKRRVQRCGDGTHVWGYGDKDIDKDIQKELDAARQFCLQLKKTGLLPFNKVTLIYYLMNQGLYIFKNKNWQISHKKTLKEIYYQKIYC